MSEEVNQQEEKQFSIAKTFGIEGVPDTLMVKGRSERTEFVPDIDPDYIFRKDVLSDVLAWHTFGANEGLWLTGPTGSGKTSILDQVAARLNIPVWTANGHGRLETPELVGHYALINGNMDYVYGPLTQAMKNGDWFRLDEIDYLDPATSAGLNTVVEGRPLVIPEKGGEIIKPAKGFKFAVTSNSAGNGDSTGLYQGVVRQNIAFMDRFWMTIVGYPEEAQELTILKKVVPSIPEEIHKTMIEYANQVRKQFQAQQIEVTMSTRTLVRWARLADFFRPLKGKGVNPIHHALDRALAFRAEPETAASLKEIAQRLFGG